MRAPDLSTPAVVLGLTPTGLYVARQLARAGVETVGVVEDFACGSWSRCLTSSEGVWRVSSGDDLEKRLQRFSQRRNLRPVLIPTSDRFVEFVVKRHERLGEVAVFQRSYSDGVAETLLDKTSFYKICEELKIPAAGIWFPQSRGDLDSIGREAHFPCLLKPRLIHKSVLKNIGSKVVIVQSADEWGKVTAEVVTEPSEWLVQEIIQGPESEIAILGFCVASDGRVHEFFSGRKLRQYPPGFGSASLAVSERIDEAIELSKDLLSGAGFRGICGTEFKKDPRDGRFKIIEVNPRPTLWFQLTHDAGCRLALATYSDLVGTSMPEPVPQRDGVVWRYAMKDAYSKSFYRRKNEAFVLPVPSPDDYIKPSSERSWCVWDTKDPKPALAEMVQYVRKAVGRGWHRR